MINPRLQKEKKQIDELFDRVRKFSGDSYDKALLTQFLCLRVSGFLENCMRIIFSEYSHPRSSDHVRDFIDNKFKRMPNPSYEAILKFTEQFSKTWKINLKKILSSNHGTSLDSIINNRNAIAHGLSSSIRLSELEVYYKDAVEVVQKLEVTCR